MFFKQIFYLCWLIWVLPFCLVAFLCFLVFSLLLNLIPDFFKCLWYQRQVTQASSLQNSCSKQLFGKPAGSSAYVHKNNSTIDIYWEVSKNIWQMLPKKDSFVRKNVIWQTYGANQNMLNLGKEKKGWQKNNQKWLVGGVTARKSDATHSEWPRCCWLILLDFLWGCLLILLAFYKTNK